MEQVAASEVTTMVADRAAVRNVEPRAASTDILAPASVLRGILAKWGYSLPLVTRVPGDLIITEIVGDTLNGFLIAGEHRIRVRIERNAMGPLLPLRRYLEMMVAHDQYALSDVILPGVFSGRAWIEGDGVIVILIRAFEMNVPLTEEGTLS